MKKESYSYKRSFTLKRTYSTHSYTAVTLFFTWPRDHVAGAFGFATTPTREGTVHMVCVSCHVRSVPVFARVAHVLKVERAVCAVCARCARVCLFADRFES